MALDTSSAEYREAERRIKRAIEDRVKPLEHRIEAQALVIAQLQLGSIIALMHVFNCLHDHGVLPLSNAISSLELTAEALPADAGPARSVVRGVAAGLRTQPTRQGPENPPAATRADLRIIQGGRAEGSPEHSGQ